MAAVGKRHYPFLPVGLLLKHRFDSAFARPKIHGARSCAWSRCAIASSRPDHAKLLFDAWAGPKRWVALEKPAITPSTPIPTTGEASTHSE
jgi:hypothetical protein